MDLKTAATRAIWPVVLALFAAGAEAAGPDDLVDSDQAVSRGREALGSSWRFPWYDDQTDGVRRVKVKPPWQPPDWTWNWSSPFPHVSWLQLLAWIAVVVLFAVLAYWLIKAYLNRENRAPGTPSGLSRHTATADAARLESLPFQIRRGASDLLAEARRLYEQGSFGEAVVYLFSYQLVEMDKNQIIRLTKGKTNRQYLRELGRRVTLRGLVEQSMVAFEDVFFGDRLLDRRRFESCWTRLGEFHALSRQEAAA